MGRVRQRGRRAARASGRAEDPRRPVQRGPRGAGLRGAHRPGRGGPPLRPFSTRLVVPSARVAEEYGMLFVEPAGAAKEVFEQGFENLFYAAPP
ncbi:hypothetical protein NKG05_22560 [Oerskovia sp. M15]